MSGWIVKIDHNLVHHQQYLYLFQDRLRSQPSGSMKFHQKRFALAAMVTQLHNHLDIRILLGLSESPTGITQTFLFMRGLNGNVLTLAEIMIECFLGKDNWRKMLMIYILKVKNVHRKILFDLRNYSKTLTT